MQNEKLDALSMIFREHEILTSLETFGKIRKICKIVSIKNFIAAIFDNELKLRLLKSTFLFFLKTFSVLSDEFFLQILGFWSFGRTHASVQNFSKKFLRNYPKTWLVSKNVLALSGAF